MEKCQFSLIKPLKTELFNFVVVIVFVVVVLVVAVAVVVIVGVFRTTSEADEKIQLIKFTHEKKKKKNFFLLNSTNKT